MSKSPSDKVGAAEKLKITGYMLPSGVEVLGLILRYGKEETIVQGIEYVAPYFETYAHQKQVEARIDSAEMALRACPTKDHKLRLWLEEHIAHLRKQT